MPEELSQVSRDQILRSPTSENLRGLTYLGDRLIATRWRYIGNLWVADVAFEK